MQEVRRRRLVIFILLASVPAECSCGVDSEKELVGTYRVENEEGYAILTLHADRTYLQTIHYKDGRELTAEGKWEFRTEHQALVLWNSYAVFPSNFGGKFEADMLPVRKMFGSVSLVTNADYGLVYKKQKE